MSPLRAAVVRRSCLAAILLCGLPATLAAAASAEAPAATAEVAVTLVEVPVQVWRGNEPVLDLTAADFQVRERGKALSIVAVEPVDLVAAPASPTAAPSPPAPVPQALSHEGREDLQPQGARLFRPTF